MTLKYVATCLFGLEHMLGEEIDALGYKRINTIDGRVVFEGDENAVARCNIGLRFAERVFYLVGECRAATFEQLFEGTRSLGWEDFIGERDEFPVKGHSIKSALFSIPDCQKIVKKAVVERLKSKYNTPWFSEDGKKYQIEFFILKDEAMLMIDTSGIALHKRGYRPGTLDAPLRETLAAALVELSRPREDVLFWDPFCGSGTIAIEAAMKMKNIAPGLCRSFAAEQFDLIPKSVWKDARDEAKSAVKDTDFEAYASDINPECVAFAKECVKRAGVIGTVKAFERNALEISTGGRRGTIVCNPPYGERMFTMAKTENLYRKMGEHFKTLEPWQIYVITSHEGFERLYGRRADKVRKLYNGMIPCYFYQFFKRRDAK